MKKDMIKYTIRSFVFWIASLYAMFLAIHCWLLGNATSLVQLLFLFAVGCFIYIDIVLVMEYIKINKMLTQIRTVERKYKYFETYIDENVLVIETLKDEVESLKKDLNKMQIKAEKVVQDEKFVKYAVRLKQ